MNDKVNNPSHYTSHQSGVECIELTEHLNFNRGNALKYVWRHELKNAGKEDLQKAAWYIKREIERESSLEPSEQAKPSKAYELAYDRLYDFYLIHDDFGFFKFMNDVLFGHESDLNDAIQYINNLIES